MREFNRALSGRVFVAMPFDRAFDDVYHLCICPIVERVYGQCTRMDQLYPQGAVVDAISDCIHHADLVIADLSRSNPNVTFELGVAKTLQKPLILISQPGVIPFDLRHLPVIHYQRQNLSALVPHLEAAVLGN